MRTRRILAIDSSIGKVAYCMFDDEYLQMIHEARLTV